MEKLDHEANEAGTEGLTVLLSEEAAPKPERKIFKRLKNVMTYHSVCTVNTAGQISSSV